jgi:hypothetical protein
LRTGQMEGKAVFITGAQRLWVESERLVRLPN